MKGMVFVGCSFTHGHGLWTYGDFSGKRLDDNPNDDKINTFELYTRSKRFPRLVANHFNSWEYVRESYSGDDENSIGLLNHMFEIDSNIKFYEDIKFDFDDISHVIFQTSYIDRCPYIYNDSTKDRKHISKIPEDQQISTLFNWGFTNIDDYYDALRVQWYTEIRNMFLLLEENGIKTYLLSITDDYKDFIKNDSYINKKVIKLKYENKDFETITDLFDYDKKLMIMNDTNALDNPPMDFHPSMKCHTIIANSIIDKIQKNG